MCVLLNLIVIDVHEVCLQHLCNFGVQTNFSAVHYTHYIHTCIRLIIHMYHIHTCMMYDPITTPYQHRGQQDRFNIYLSIYSDFR
jgi:hypothetical protein